MRKLILIAALALAACSSDVKDTKMSEIDFANPASVQSIAQKLQPDEREVFNYYITSRTMAGSLGIKEVVTSEGKAPATVREALSLSKAAYDRSKARSKIVKARNEAVTKHNALMDGIEIKPENRAEWDRLERQIEQYDKQLEAYETDK